MMHCQKPTKCAACQKVFSSLCKVHFHLRKGFVRRGYLYSVHMSDDGQLLVYSAKGSCSGRQTGYYEPKKPKEHNFINRKEVVACTEIPEGQHNSSNPPEDNLGQLKSVFAPEDNLGQLKSVIAYEDNLGQLKSVVATEDSLGQLKSVVASEDSLGHLKSVVAPEDSLGHLKSVVASEDNLGQLKSVVASEDSLEQMKSVVASEDNLGQLKSVVASEDNLGQLKSAVAPEDNVGQLNLVFACQENNEHTAKHKSNQRSVKVQGETSEMLDKCVAVNENETEKSQKQSLEPTSKLFDVLPTVTSTVKKIAPQQVFVYSSGRISSFEKEFSVKGSDVAIFSKRKAENTTLKSPSMKSPSNVVESAPAVVKKQIIRIGLTRNDNIKAKFKDIDSAGKCVSSSSVANAMLPQSTSADIGECADLGLPHTSEDEIRKFVKPDVKQLKHVYNISPTCNVTPVLLVENQHRRNVDDNNIVLEDLCKIDQEEIKGHSTNMNKEVSEQLGTVSSGDKEAYQQNGANLNRPCLRQIHGGIFVMAGDVSNTLDSSETELLLTEHSYCKTVGASDVQSQQDERKDLDIYNNFENRVSIMYENTISNPREIEIEFPDNVISTHSLTEVFPAQPNTSLEQCYPCKDSNGINRTCVSSEGRRNSCSLKASARERDRLNEIDVKIPPVEEQAVCVFSKYGFRMIQRTNFYIECRFCLQTWSRYEILDHIESIHLKHLECLHPTCQQFTNRFQHEIKSLSRYLNDNWDPDSRFVEITLVRGKRYRFCGFSIKPCPELKFMCSSCNKSFCRNNLINHVTDCYKQHEINLTQEFNDQFELLKKIIPVFKIEEKKKQENITVKKEARITRTKKTKRNHSENYLLREFKAAKPYLFKTNKTQFLKEFKAYSEQKREEIRKKQKELISCSVCSTKVKAGYLKTHMRYAHTSETYPCEVCGGIYPSDKALYNHRRYVHGEEGQFPCSVCGKILATKLRLGKHYSQIHRSQKLIPCQMCGKGFKNKHLLSNHMSVHTGTRPFSCHVCKARFKRPDHLKSHIDTVHDLKILWVCSAPGCESRYKNKGELEDHVQRHKGKTFFCSFCPQQYTTLKCLNSHMKKSHSVKEAIKDSAARVKSKEMDYGFDGSIKLKTILIPEGELKYATVAKPFRWTDSEKKIFWNVMDKYFKAGSLAPMSAFKKVEKELKGTRTLKQIRVKFEVARRAARQRLKELQRENDIETPKQTEMPARAVTNTNEMVENNEAELIFNDDMEHETDENSTLAEEQIDVVSYNYLNQNDSSFNREIAISNPYFYEYVLQSDTCMCSLQKHDQNMIFKSVCTN